MDSNENPGQKVIETLVTMDGGVLNVTVAMIASRAMRRTAVAVLKQVDPAAYEQYKALKFPGATLEGARGEATLESRATAYSWALDRASSIAKAGYVRGV